MTGAYTFLAWARKGVANSISAADVGKLRASVKVALDVDTVALDGTRGTSPAPVPPVELYGPPDIIGIDAQRSDAGINGVISRIEPRDGITNFEPNYLASIEFLDEDFPWRYTPAPAPSGAAHLTPWLMLVVLKDEIECRLQRKEAQQPLDFMTVEGDGGQSFPSPDTLWAWAHVHVNEGLTGAAVVASDNTAVAARLDAAVGRSADVAYSRILGPRRLEPDTNYRACLVPAFEGGRLAGLGLPLDAVTGAAQPAWTVAGPPAGTPFPLYFTWTFRTGTIGDFESLVRLLQPRPVDKSVGVRAIDVSAPHPVLSGIGGATGGVLALGGALRAPRGLMSIDDRTAAEAQDRWATPYPTAFQTDLARFINLADAYAVQPSAQANAQISTVANTAGDDPVITPPLYGRWHALTDRLLTDRGGATVAHPQNWVHELNLDPRYRVAAGLGVRVVQDRQEDLMNSAWAQLGDVLKANSRMRLMKVAQHTAHVWRQKALSSIAALDPARLLMLTAPLHGRIIAAGGSDAVTLRARAGASRVTAALFSPTLRRIGRTRGRIARSAQLAAQGGLQALIGRIDRGELALAPAKVTPAGVATVASLADKALEQAAPAWLRPLLQTAPWIVPMPLVVAILLGLVGWLLGAGALALLLVAAGAALSAWLYRQRQQVNAAGGIREERQTPEAVADLKHSPDFTLVSPGTAKAVTLRASGPDSPEAQRFKNALTDAALLVEATVAADAIGENGPARQPLQIAEASATVLAAIEPSQTFPRRAAATIRVPERIRRDMVEDGIVEAMAYPVFDTPMFRPLSELSADLLIPNINKVDNNSVTLLETNQPFIEAYMAGLNYEFGRELLWREYPTDQRGSYFRQFWEVASLEAATTTDPEALRERLRDIPPLHTWLAGSRLGDHDARANRAEDVVLVIRGELLKRYPTAVIYAHAAEWQRDSAGRLDSSQPRILVPLTPQEEEQPPSTTLRMPLFSAKMEPDLSFLGFDLTVEDVRGGETASAPAGWFFVVKECPGEPRFGLDETSARPANELSVWNDLGWDLALAAGTRCLSASPAQPVSIAADAASSDQQDQHTDDAAIVWNNDVSAAELAYILFQSPVRIAIHARELLGDGS